MLLHIYNTLWWYNVIPQIPSTTAFPTLKTEAQFLISSTVPARRPPLRAGGTDFHQWPSAKSPRIKQLVKNQKSFSEEQATSNTHSITITSTETLQEARNKLNCALSLCFLSTRHWLSCLNFIFESSCLGWPVHRAARWAELTWKYFCPLNTAALALTSWRLHWSG